MDGDPVDPISFEQALKELWHRLAADVGLNLRDHLLSENQASADWRERDERLQLLRADAWIMLLGFIIVGPARWWVADGENWKRPPPETLPLRMAMAPRDEPIGVYVDRVEIEAAIAESKPELSRTGWAKQRVGKGLKRRRGRPPGSGSYAKIDEPFVDLMEVLIKSGRAKSRHEASMRAAEQGAPGNSIESTARRLRDRHRRKYGVGE